MANKLPLPGTLLAALLAALLVILPARAEVIAEYELKAAVIYRLASYVEWPDGLAAASARKRDTLTLCVVGHDPFGPALDALVEHPPGVLRLTLRRLAATEAVRNCDLVWLGLEDIALARALETLRGTSVLTLTDGAGAARRGVMIELLLEQRRVHFAINLKAIQHARLNLSSKLLRLARAIYQETP